MSHITREEIVKLAKSANLHISDEEIPMLLNRLEEVLSYASYLKDLAAQHEGAPLPDLSNVTRQDVVTQTAIEPLLGLAPEREENFFVVPAILKQQADHE